jgi:hypothetical protein
MFGLGVDIGKHADPCAIIGVQLRPRIVDPNLPDAPAMDAGYMRRPSKLIYEYQVNLMERPDLGTNYSKVELRIVDIMKTPAYLDETRLIVDLGEVGDAIFERWRDVHQLDPLGIRFTSGNTVTRTEQGYNVPKTQLIAPLMNVFASRRIRFARMNEEDIRRPGADGMPPTEIQVAIRREYVRLKKIIQKELQGISMDFTKKGNMTIGDRQRGDGHFDMVMALSMPVWYFEHIYKQHFAEGQVTDKKQQEHRNWNPLWDGEEL